MGTEQRDFIFVYFWVCVVPLHLISYVAIQALAADKQWTPADTLCLPLTTVLFVCFV